MSTDSPAEQMQLGGAIADARATPEERAQRARLVAQAVRNQDALKAAQNAAQAPAEDTQRALAYLDRIERRATGADDPAVAQEHARRQAIYAANVKHGYTEWAPLLDDDGGQP